MESCGEGEEADAQEKSTPGASSSWEGPHVALDVLVQVPGGILDVWVGGGLAARVVRKHDLELESLPVTLQAFVLNH